MVSWVYMTVCFQCVYYEHVRLSSVACTFLARGFVTSGGMWTYLGVGSSAERDSLVTSVKVGIEPTQKGVDVCEKRERGVQISAPSSERSHKGRNVANSQSCRVASNSKGAVKSRSSILTVFKSISYESSSGKARTQERNHGDQSSLPGIVTGRIARARLTLMRQGLVTTLFNSTQSTRGSFKTMGNMGL